MNRWERLNENLQHSCRGRPDEPPRNPLSNTRRERRPVISVLRGFFEAEDANNVDAALMYWADCQSAFKFDPISASNFDPLGRRVLAVALAPSELVGVAETVRARAV